MRHLRTLALLLVAGAIGATAVVQAAETVPADETVKDRSAFIPTRSFEPLPGETVGILVSDVQKVMALEGRSGPPEALAFSRGGVNYRWVYVEVEHKPRITNLDVPVGDKGAKKRYDKLDMASLPTVKHWGITEPYALVEVEVNSGLGSPVGDSFVATRVKKLDGGKEYPLQVAEVIAGLRKRYQAELHDQQKALDAALAGAQKEALEDQAPTGPRETTEVMYVTWDPRAEQVQVRFHTTITDGAYQYSAGGAQPVIDEGFGPPPRRPPVRPPVPRPGVRFGTQFGVEWGRGYDVSKTGAVQRTRTLPAQSFTKVLPPPPAPALRPSDRPLPGTPW